MRKIGLFAAVATLALVAVAAWGTSTASTTYARFDVVPAAHIDTRQLVAAAKEMPEIEFVDYTFVYN